MAAMGRGLVMVVSLAAATRAHADGVFEVCKGESKTVVSGRGRMSIAVVYPDTFPAKTTPAMRNAVGARLARAEQAKIVPAKDVFAATVLVAEKRWSSKTAACGFAPSLIAVLGQKHTNLATGIASVTCDQSDACELHVDLERHGRPMAERWVRYAAPLRGSKEDVGVIAAAAAKLSAGPAPDHPTRQAATTGVVTMRSDVDGALEVDRTMEASPAFAGCRPHARKANDVRGYWAEWTLSALGKPTRVRVQQFQGTDASDREVAECLTRALEDIQLACPRDGAPVAVKTAICL